LPFIEVLIAFAKMLFLLLYTGLFYPSGVARYCYASPFQGYVQNVTIMNETNNFTHHSTFNTQN